MRFTFACALVVGAMTFAHFPAFAEGDDEAIDPAVLTYMKARNQLGLFGYCKDKGFVGEDAITAQKTLMSLTPVPEAVKGDADAEKDIQNVEDKGKIGQILDNELDLYNLADIAKHRKETEEAMCKALANPVIAAAAKMPRK